MSGFSGLFYLISYIDASSNALVCFMYPREAVYHHEIIDPPLRVANNGWVALHCIHVNFHYFHFFFALKAACCVV